MLDDLSYCMEHVIHVENLTRVFGKGENSKRAVDNISFDVERGEIFGILGPNGAGKTTTIKMLSTLLLPTSGTALVLGQDVMQKDVTDLRRKVNVVSGGERGLYYRLTGRQNMQYFADLYGIPKKDQKELIDRLLEKVELTDAADKKIEDYSRGMKQRIHIARSLVNDPEILFLDEPTIGLDPEISKGIRKLVRALSDGGTTVILTTHYMFEAEELCSRAVILSKGKIKGYGSITELKDMVSDTSMIRIVTSNDPAELMDKAKGTDGVIEVRMSMISGRYETNIQSEKAKDVLPLMEELFAPLDIRSIGYDEPTLEDAYLHLVGGE